MIEMLMSLALAFGISFYALPAIINITIEKGLFDFPDDRKRHHKPIPSLGGLAIYAGFIMAFLITVSFAGSRFVFQYFLAATLVIFFIGLKDDLLNLVPFKKFLGQVLAASLLVFKGGLVISNLGGVFGIHELQPLVAEVLTVFTLVVIINAYNLIDGVDGLAGTLSIISSGLFAAFFAINGDYAYACMATALIGATLAFLIFNYAPARIFMGDTGSLLLGLVNGAMVIHFIQTAGSAPVLAVESAGAVGFAIMFVPLFDTLRVFSYRIVRGISPFTPDRNHVHHILLRFGWSHTQVTIALSIAAVLFAGLGWGLQSFGNSTVLMSIISVGFLMIGTALWSYKMYRRRMLADKSPRIHTAPVIPVKAKKAAN
ncbi:MraY family glycosyltransferase [Phnomibacter sp. MR]|uniref:MraY family glycosyltransferase n=1 Tax=Phnomibacter sp. MR TaxID=3042318 RepID=UPI003A7FFE7D